MKALAFLAPLLAMTLASATPSAQGLRLNGDTECLPTDLKNGVWFFKTCAGGFGNNLSKFKAANPNLVVMAIAAAGNYTGYYVSTEQRNTGGK